MFRTVLAVAAIAIGVTAVAAQSDPIAARKALMKEQGAQTKTGAGMAKGEAPFDLAKAQAILANYVDTSAKMPDLFPANSKAGGETTAAPKIWESQAEFRKRFDDWAADIKKASAQTKDLDSFKEAFGTVTKACGGCHETFRIKKG
jgi:cytochrome c556